MSKSIIQLLCNVMAAMAGDQFQTAALTVGLNGIIQIFVVRHLPVDGKGVVQEVEKVVGVQADGKALALLGDRQVF